MSNSLVQASLMVGDMQGQIWIEKKWYRPHCFKEKYILTDNDWRINFLIGPFYFSLWYREEEYAP